MKTPPRHVTLCLAFYVSCGFFLLLHQVIMKCFPSIFTYLRGENVNSLKKRKRILQKKFV